MKTLIITLLLTTLAQACVPPIQPIPPIGCTSSDAVLINNGYTCYWVFMGC